MKLKGNSSKITLVVILLIMTIVSSNLNWGGDSWKGIIEADAKGYYAYLPALFIYKDLNFGFFDEIEKEKYYNKNFYYDYRAFSNGKIINKYYCGTAIAELPFFIIAHFSSSWLGYETDGYSNLYPILINIAAIFYLILGLFYLNSTLILFKIKDWQRTLTIIAAVFGTNLFYYTVGEPGLSHIFSFAFISMFIYYSKQYFSTFHSKYIIVLASLLGIIVLTRPINGLILFIWPFIAQNPSTLLKGIKEGLLNKIKLLTGIGIFAGIVSIQLIIYKISTGNFFVYSYAEEGFNFLSPHIFDILFSYKKGLFLYTPLYLLSLTGLFFLWKSSKFEFFSVSLFLFGVTYIFSSWWMWYYGGSFSSRVYVEFIPVFMILLALSLHHIKKAIFRKVYIAGIVLLIVLCQIQTYQYRYYQIHWADMTKEKYWDVFLRVDKL